MKYLYVLTFLLFMLCSACKKNESIDSFSDVRTIVDYDSLYSDKYDPLGTIREFEVVDSLIILLNSQEGYSFFFINAHNGSLLAKWGREGRGPGEYLRIGPEFSISGSQLVFLDATKKEINYIPLTNILNGTDLSVTNMLYPYVGEFRPQYITPVKNKKIVLGSLEQGRFGVLDSENKIIDSPFDYPFSFPEIQGIYRGNVFQSKIKSNEKLNKFVIMTQVSDIFEIYEITDVSIERSYIYPFNHIPKIIEKPRPGVTHTIDYDKSVAGLMRMAVSEELICFTYSSENDTQATQKGKNSNEILCFDWEGNKIKKYILPFPISNFCVDDENIYGVRIIDGETVIYRFEMI